jgi:hypothetical protein
MATVGSGSSQSPGSIVPIMMATAAAANPDPAPNNDQAPHFPRISSSRLIEAASKVFSVLRLRSPGSDSAMAPVRIDADIMAKKIER